MPRRSRWWTRLWRRRPRPYPQITDRMQAKFDDLNHRLGHLHETIQQLSKRVDDIDWRLAGLETKRPNNGAPARRRGDKDPLSRGRSS
jgi:hypothetical protein